MPDEAYFEKKADKGKPHWSLLPWRPVAAIVDVLTYGAQKYAAESWRTVPDAKQRYTDALFRHLTAWLGGQSHDEESGLHHLSHALCNLMFLWELSLGPEDRGVLDENLPGRK